MVFRNDFVQLCIVGHLFKQITFKFCGDWGTCPLAWWLRKSVQEVWGLITDPVRSDTVCLLLLRRCFGAGLPRRLTRSAPPFVTRFGVIARVQRKFHYVKWLFFLFRNCYEQFFIIPANVESLNITFFGQIFRRNF